MRIHKDVARALKSEVALFEGTWEKYHKAGKMISFLIRYLERQMKKFTIILIRLLQLQKK